VCFIFSAEVTPKAVLRACGIPVPLNTSHLDSVYNGVGKVDGERESYIDRVDFIFIFFFSN
jgi:hypothetical protein